MHHSLVNSDEEQTPFEMGDEGEMAAAKAAADLAETQAGGRDLLSSILLPLISILIKCPRL